MKRSDLTADEISRRGQAIYETIRPDIESGNRGKFVVIDIESGGYEMDSDDLAVSRRASQRFPDGTLLLMRIGHAAAYDIGGASSGPSSQ